MHWWGTSQIFKAWGLHYLMLVLLIPLNSGEGQVERGVFEA
ncbi:hypothetical protein KR51_00036430 [Rubidibacter lacunae KORDI 51-2]|uniref:Uncharacterized protein n=1 Tax=Rubidibacter lacunae KORDI 51-2 TaxID=582515 RepID=U5DE12_9CHRO|nr:hypothetical protein [Rubidibacter lacunae]ERN39861.1 hypothetical protein KR51_00036430 [Rubidibacter lacunae KORDI 51-2]